MSLIETAGTPAKVSAGQTLRLRLTIHGTVQGVGFRPFVHRLATELALRGWVLNGNDGVRLEVEGPSAGVEQFLTRLQPECPPRACIQRLEPTFLDPAGYADFTIRASTDTGLPSVRVPADIATCDDCLREIRDPGDRRHRYPFTNCTNCGPRYSIIESLPYDRARTAMKIFPMCPACRAEYNDPRNRRFHAQPNACPVCGPQLALWDPRGRVVAERETALQQAAGDLREGRIVALKGIGGFQLLVDARNSDAVRELRRRKHRSEKPFALLFPNLAAVRAACAVAPLEARLLASPETPIVLLKRRAANADAGPAPHSATIAAEVAPGNPNLGAMLPCSPLHHLLCREIQFPVVATSGNLSDEPLCIDELEALERLGGIADSFLIHNRPIVRPIDDSVARILLGREQLLRVARGYAPLTITVPRREPSVLAVGGQMKNAIALARPGEIILSQHIGNLDSPVTEAAFRQTARALQTLYAHTAVLTAGDLHPAYRANRMLGPPSASVRVQHHYAHALAGLADNECSPPALAVVWDGAGLGADGTIWGGEFLRLHPGGFERVAHLRTFRLPGGEQAVWEPRRTALGLLFALWGEALFAREEPLLSAFSATERTVLRQSLVRNLNAPETSSAGRLFDAVAALLGLRQTVSFNGQAAMDLEFSLLDRNRLESSAAHADTTAYPLPLVNAVLDWAPTVEAILADRTAGVPVGLIAARFHLSLADAIVEVARLVNEPRVLLTGGCFQNQALTENTVTRLRAAGFQAYWHQRIPPNDGGLAVGQALAAGQGFRKAP